MEDLRIVREFEKVAELMPERALRLIKKDPELLKGDSYLRVSRGDDKSRKSCRGSGVTREKVIEEFRKKGIPVRTPDREDVLSEVEVWSVYS